MIKVLCFGTNFVPCDEIMSQKKEVRKMKKLLGFLLVFGLMTSAAYAVNPDTCVMTVTPAVIYSVAIASDGVVQDFGTVDLGLSAEIYVGTITNDGNVNCDLLAQGSNTAAWTNSTAIGTDLYTLQVATNSGQTATADGTWTLTATVGGDEMATNSATNGLLVAGADEYFNAKITLPDTSSNPDQQTLTLSIWAAITD